MMFLSKVVICKTYMYCTFIQVMKKSVITPDFEKKDCIAPYTESERQLKKQRRVTRYHLSNTASPVII